MLPGHPDYDAARRVWNGMFDRRPAAIARVQGAVDVVAVVNHAREAGLELAVRGGGHSSAGYSTVDGGLVLDLSRMRGVRVDPVARVAHAQAGALWGDVDRETQAHGLAVPGGQISHTGIAGLTLGGGIGWLSRKHGLTIDNLLSVDLVTADGRLVRASATEHPDLFWGLRGGSGNFGVVVSFEYRLHEVGPLVLGGPILYGLDDAAAALRNARDFIVDAPDDVSLWLVLTHVSSGPAGAGGAPRDAGARRRPVLHRPRARPRAAGAAHVVRVAARTLPRADPLRRAAVRARRRRPPRPSLLGAGRLPRGPPRRRDRRARRRARGRSRPHGARSSSSRWAAPSHASPPRRPPSGTARRRGRCGSRASGPTPPRTTLHRDWTRGFSATLAPWTTGAVYVNAIGGDVTDARKAAAYGGPAKLERLRELKRAWDPENLFHLNANVAP